MRGNEQDGDDGQDGYDDECGSLLLGECHWFMPLLDFVCVSLDGLIIPHTLKLSIGFAMSFRIPQKIASPS